MGWWWGRYLFGSVTRGKEGHDAAPSALLFPQDHIYLEQEYMGSTTIESAASPTHTLTQAASLEQK